MSLLETNLKNTNPRPHHLETKVKIETETTKIGLKIFITVIFLTRRKNEVKVKFKAITSIRFQ